MSWREEEPPTKCEGCESQRNCRVTVMSASYPKEMCQRARRGNAGKQDGRYNVGVVGPKMSCIR